MSKAELRKKKLREVSAAGDTCMELTELRKLRREKQVEGLHTITTGCGGVLTLICC